MVAKGSTVPDNTLAPEKSDRQLAKAIGVSPTTVGTARKDLEQKGEVSKLDTSIGKDGKEYPRQVGQPQLGYDSSIVESFAPAAV